MFTAVLTFVFRDSQRARGGPRLFVCTLYLDGKTVQFCPLITKYCLFIETDSAFQDAPVFTILDPGGEKGGGETVQGGLCI